MPSNELQTFYTELAAGMPLAKCQKCGCMRETLDMLAAALPNVDATTAVELVQHHADWVAVMQPVQYSCLGCDHCYAGAAQNAFTEAFPLAVSTSSLSCTFEESSAHWPPVIGEYFVVDPAAPVAVSTLASIDLAEQLAQRKPAGLAIVGKTETENIGLDKLIKNFITNPALRFLIVTGREAEGHRSGQTLLALAANGVDDKGRVLGSPGKRPVLRNVSLAEINAFRQQVQVIDLISCENLDEIADRITGLAESGAAICSCGGPCDTPVPVAISTVTPLAATGAADAVVMDKAGYFVIVPLADRGVINVEHYDYDNTLLHIVEGQSACALYATIIAKGWVGELSHAAYLGKELAKAELSQKHGFNYVQDGA